MQTLTAKQQKVMETFAKILPSMSDQEAERLLSFGEGIAFKASQQKGADNATGDTDSESTACG